MLNQLELLDVDICPCVWKGRTRLLVKGVLPLEGDH